MLCMVLTMLPTAALAAEPPISLYLDENPFPMTDAAPEIRNDRTMIPLRALAERLGADVEWKGETSQIVLTRAGSTIIMIVGETAALVNGAVVQMDVAPYINSGGRTLIPARYVAGYITYAEALALLEPAAILLKEKFTTWDEAYENYLDGYHWWSRSNVLGKNVWESERGKLYQNAKVSKESGYIFDDTLFTRPIISVPGLTANALVKQTFGN